MQNFDLSSVSPDSDQRFRMSMLTNASSTQAVDGIEVRRRSFVDMFGGGTRDRKRRIPFFRAEVMGQIHQIIYCSKVNARR